MVGTMDSMVGTMDSWVGTADSRVRTAQSFPAAADSQVQPLPSMAASAAAEDWPAAALQWINEPTDRWTGESLTPFPLRPPAHRDWRRMVMSKFFTIDLYSDQTPAA